MSELLPTTEVPVVKEEPDELKYELNSGDVLKAEPSEETQVKVEVELGPIQLMPVDVQYVMSSCKKEMNIKTEREDLEEFQDTYENESYEQTEDHQRTETSEEIIQLPNSNSHKDLRMHLESGTGEKQQPVKRSPVTYKFKQTVAPGVNKLEAPQKCNICRKTFALKANYNSHIKTHITEPSLSPSGMSHSVEPRDGCVNEEPNSTTSGIVDARTDSVDDNDNRSRRCDTCKKYVNNENHTGEKIRYKCDTCNKSMGLRNKLIIHNSNTLISERPYHCKICNKCFITISDLEQHNETHTRERSFKCHICDKSYTHSCNLIIHLRTHTGERPYQCKVCSKRFIASTVLRQHTKTHTGERPYECQICDRGFAQRGDLIIHIRTHTGERPYYCKICNKRFISNSYLKYHTRTKHSSVT